jgi:hypothetical protein
MAAIGPQRGSEITVCCEAWVRVLDVERMKGGMGGWGSERKVRSARDHVFCGESTGSSIVYVSAL